MALCDELEGSLGLKVQESRLLLEAVLMMSLRPRTDEAHLSLVKLAEIQPDDNTTGLYHSLYSQGNN